MKIIENGLVNHPWGDRVTCTKGCQSILEIQASDVFYEEWNDVGGEINQAYFVECPVCGLKVFLKKDKVPPVVQREAERRRYHGGP